MVLTPKIPPAREETWDDAEENSDKALWMLEHESEKMAANRPDHWKGMNGECFILCQLDTASIVSAVGAWWDKENDPIGKFKQVLRDLGDDRSENLEDAVSGGPFDLNEFLELQQSTNETLDGLEPLPKPNSLVTPVPVRSHLFGDSL